MNINQLCAALLLVIVPMLSQADQPQQLEVAPLDFTPRTDGELNEWQALEPNLITIKPAIEDDKKNRTGTLEVKLWAGVSDGVIHVATQWPDDAPNTDFRPWKWRGKKYRRSKGRDDMFALRFALSGEFNRSMIADANYTVDVWVWSAGRSNKVGIASDHKHTISLKMIDDVAEYETESGNTVFIDRDKDEGNIGFATHKPGKTRTETNIPSIKISGDASGSIADVAARGVWKDGFWTVEMQRLLDTGHDDDVRLFAGQEILGQIAVFNKSGAEHKSISEPLLFRFSD